MVKTGALVDQELETSDPSLELHSRVNVNLLAMFDIVQLCSKEENGCYNNESSLFICNLFGGLVHDGQNDISSPASPEPP